MRSKKYRNLRIAFSAGCGVLCLLLIVLWVRSYSVCDSLGISSGHQITSLYGRLFFDEQFTFTDAKYLEKYGNLKLLGYSVNLMTIGLGVVTPAGRMTAIPLWIPIAAGATLAAAPWLRWRFSLRTLLIATAIIAVLLGAVVWAVK